MDEPGHQPAPAPPVACGLSGTPGAFAERMAEYRRLLAPAPGRAQPDRRGHQLPVPRRPGGRGLGA